jgi:hypothetical protein
MHLNNQTPVVEHYVTLFNNNFLLSGLCLHSSLTEQCAGSAFQLWILCMDIQVQSQLEQLALPYVRLISLAEVENDNLLEVKPTRTIGEYCWTMTPFVAQFVFERDTTVQRVTYLDADLYFFKSPNILLAEFEQSGKHIMITEHAYPPKKAHSARAIRAGRFCVQFMTFRRTSEAINVLNWWQARCLEWCYARVENGKYGDQKYLDSWPTLFAQDVHILQQKEKTLAPWNVNYYAEVNKQHIAPVFYHFHGFRHVAPGRLLLYSGYNIGLAGMTLYGHYVKCFVAQGIHIKSLGMKPPVLPPRKHFLGYCIALKRRLWDGEMYITDLNLCD